MEKNSKGMGKEGVGLRGQVGWQGQRLVGCAGTGKYALQAASVSLSVMVVNAHHTIYGIIKSMPC